MQTSRSFITPEVNLLFFSVYQLMHIIELLMAQGIIPQNEVTIRASKASKIYDNLKECTREDKLPSLSKQHSAHTVKKEEMSVDAYMQQI
jgi:hypothetical protein